MRNNGDLLRDSQLWLPAAQLYKSYLEICPRDAPIWIQLGHCQKEAGLLNEADSSYCRAAAMVPESAEIWLQIGHLRKLQGRLTEAAANYAKALTKEPSLVPALTELEHLRASAPEMEHAIGELRSRLSFPVSPPISNLTTKPSEAEHAKPGAQIPPLAERLDDMNERISRNAEHIERLSDVSRQIESLLELTTTVKALGFAMKRQERQVEVLGTRLAWLEKSAFSQSHRADEVNCASPETPFELEPAGRSQITNKPVLDNNFGTVDRPKTDMGAFTKLVDDTPANAERGGGASLQLASSPNGLRHAVKR
jgi:tetratricopeptide (TPR) repeat protein